jgi:hypothetical protein
MDEINTDEETGTTSDEDYVEGTYFAQVHGIRDIIFGELAVSLRRKAWGEKKDREIMDICLHIAVFLSWSFRFLKSTDLDPSIESVNDAFDSILGAPHSVLEKFTNHLDVDHKKKPTTTKKYLNSIKTYAKWQAASNRKDTQSLRDCVGYITKHYATAVRKYRSEHRVSIDDMVQERKIPAGGLHKMRQLILAGIQDEMDKTVHVVTRRTYRGFCALMFSAFYTLSPQGRIGGLEHLAFNQMDELMEEWDTQSSTFKTGAKFGFQIFSLTSDTEKLFRLYINKYRPHAAGRARISSQRSNGMWLNWEGITMPAAHIGKLVTSFWERVAGVKMTTTICRSLVETLAHTAHQEGLISTTEREAIQGVNGHSGVIAKDYYLLNDRRRESHNARKGFEAMFGGDKENDSQKQSNMIFPTRPEDAEERMFAGLNNFLDDNYGDPQSRSKNFETMLKPNHRGRSQHSPKQSCTPPHHDNSDDGDDDNHDDNGDDDDDDADIGAERQDTMGSMFGPEHRNRSHHSLKQCRTPRHDDDIGVETQDTMGAMFGPEHRSLSHHSLKQSRTQPFTEEGIGSPFKRGRANEPQNSALEHIEFRDVEPITDWEFGGSSPSRIFRHANVGNGAGSNHRMIDEDESFQADRLRRLLLLMMNEQDQTKHQMQPVGCGQRRAKLPISNDRDLTDPQWGTSHPDFGRPTTRAKFTHIEVQWIGQYCTKLIRENPWMQSRMLVECLHALKLDFKMHKYFHPRHVTDAGRLRPGLEAFEKAHGKIA